MIPLSDHFTLEEFAATSHAELAKKNYDFCVANAVKLKMVASQLEIVRAHYGRSVHVNSGGRCPELNKAVGGSLTSQHMACEAADIIILGIPPRQIFDDIRRGLIPGLNLQQCIHEIKDGKEWVHLGINPVVLKPCEFLVFDGHKYTRVPSANNP